MYYFWKVHNYHSISNNADDDDAAAADDDDYV